MRIHRIIGVVLGVIFILIFSGHIDWFKGFNNTQEILESSETWISSKSRAGIGYVYIIAFLSIFFLTCPSTTKRLWHLKYGDMREPFLTEGVWIILGYLLAFVTVGIFFCFE